MGLKLVYLVVTRVFVWLWLAGRDSAAKDIEILMMRHQLAVAQRRDPRVARKLTWTDRAWPALLAGVGLVRGNWRREDESGPMLLTKSCHDIDWLMHILDETPARVSSFGSLSHFTAAEKPALATDHCVTCPVEQSCAYSAKRIYLSCIGDPVREHWPLSMVTGDRTEAGVLAALRESPYGRCVYSCDNDVVDHQVVAMEFPSGATASFTMTAFTPLTHRRTRIFGTRGCLEGDGELLRLHDFVTDQSEELAVNTEGASAADGHGGGDDALVAAFLGAIAAGDASALTSDARTSLAGHRVVWAAEHARRSGTVVTVPACAR